jgi:hypothetical protein
VFGNLGQGFGVLATVDGDPNQVGTGGFEKFDLADSGFHVLRLGGRHALYGNALSITDHDVTDSNGTCWISGSQVRHPAVTGLV